MNDLVLIGALGVFAYHAMAIGKNFRGASSSAKFWIETSGTIGYLTHMVAIIWAFWPYTWWQPIVTFVVTVVIGGVTAPIFQKSVVGMFVSCIGSILLVVATVSTIVSHFIA